MEEDAWNSPHIVTDPVAGALLADDRLRTVLMLFARGPRTLVEVAGVEPRAVKRLYHQVCRLRAAGLIKVVGERARAGRAMKLYQSVSASFFVPNELLPAPFTSGFSAELRASQLHHGFLPGSGIQFGIDAEGREKATRVEPKEYAPMIIDLWIVAQLAPADLRALKAELREVILSYRGSSAPNAKPYLIHAAAAPRV